MRECLSDPAQAADVRRHMADGRQKLGSQTYEQHVGDLDRGQAISAETAKIALAPVSPRERHRGRAPGKKGTKQATAV